MATPNPFPPQNNVQFPELHLYPLDDSFIPKRIALVPGQRVKIARPPNTKTQPGERNGYFDSRVLSRQHAEVWEEGGKIFIKDVKSSNGTFINGERLSPEGRESEPCEMKSDDMVEFGVDIVSEDNKTILHRKVVARVSCVFPGMGPQYTQEQYAGNATFNGVSPQRRPQMPMIHQGLAGLGGMGGGVRVPGRGLTLDHIFSRLQAELAKSRDTGHDLQVLTGALNNIEDTLNGASPPAAGPPQLPDANALPPVRPPQPHRAMSVPALPPVPSVENPQAQAHADAIAELQGQLREHQRALAAHVESIRALESVLAEQEAMKREVRELREFVGVDRQEEEEDEEEETQEQAQARRAALVAELELGGNQEVDDDDDARSVMTAVPRDLDSVEEVDEEAEERDARESEPEYETVSFDEPDATDASLLQDEREENILRERAQTPEPTLDNDDALETGPRSFSPPSTQDMMDHISAMAPAATALSLGELTAQLAVLTEQLESALDASSALQAQHASAQITIETLEEKLAMLEARAVEAPPPPPAPMAVPVPVQAPVAIASAELEDLQAQLAAMREELAEERGMREAWAGAVDERIKLVSANGWADAKPHHPAPANGDLWSSPSPASSPRLGLQEAVELELGLDVDLGAAKTEALALDIASTASLLGAGIVKSERSLPPQANVAAQMNVQTALGVVLLGIAAAAVLWRVKPE